MTTANGRPESRMDQAQVPAGITLVGSELRSTNLERDVRDKQLNSPYMGAKALDVLDRVTNAVDDLRRTRAWSFTGPYGSGKSTLANVLDAFLGHDEARHDEARATVEESSSALAERLTQARANLASKTGKPGFLGAVTTARREPLAATVGRALRTAAERRWKSRLPKAVSQALEACSELPTAEQLLDAVTVLCETGHPVLLIIDEFGKSLEYLAASGDDGSDGSDVFLLQMLAEKGAGRSGLPLFIFTLQHLAFSDYAARSSSIQTKEWAKVQGRFEDVTFAPHLGDSVRLLQRRLDQSAVSPDGRVLIAKHARASTDTWTEHGLNSVVHISPEMFEQLYPLHPLTTVAAPLLAFQIGQHDRSLVGFLANDEPHTVRRTLDEASAANAEHASTVRLPQLYDYFFASSRTTILASANASRWLEVDNRINEAHGLPPEDQSILKTIGILNLIDVDGVLRATPAMIQFALGDPTETTGPERFTALQERLQHLVETGFLTHRAYSDEYRVWQGTDVDIEARVKEIAVRSSAGDVVEYLAQHLGSVLPTEVVAGAHTQRTGMLRYFRTAVSLNTDKLHGPDVVGDAADGMLVFHLGTPDNRPVVNSPLPVLIGTTRDPTPILEAGITLRALEDLRHEDDIDPVAEREINERIAELSHGIGAQLDESFNPRSAQSTWYLWARGDESRTDQHEPIEARSFAALVSAACDQVFFQTPHIRNEMAGRHELTSNGARARRVLLTDLLTKTGLPVLGYDTTRYTQERAMYHGVVEYLGLHRAVHDTGAVAEDSIATHGAARPDPERNAHVIPVWQELERLLTEATRPTPIVDIYHRLMAPPYGVKAGVVPILMVAALIVRGSDVALFQEGTYCPRLTPEIIELLTAPSGPDRFTVKAVPVGAGQRKAVVDQLAAALKVDVPRSRTARNPRLLAVTRTMLERMMVLTPYGRKTKRLSARAQQVRAVLSTENDPDKLVFTALPLALDLPTITVDEAEDKHAARAYVTALTSALDEISGALEALRRDVVSAVGRAFGISGDLSVLRRGLAEALSGFVNASLELDLQGFVSRVLNTSLPDEDWLDPIIIRLTNKALGDWTDEDINNFPLRVKDMARRLDRVGHLYQAQETLELPVESASAPVEPRKIDTHLLTLTSPQGIEERTLIHVPRESRNNTERLVVSVIEQAEQALGPGGARVLLAALAERLAMTDSNPAPLGKEEL
ncbi:ATP-binding protein [Spirillospora sp. CA-255316]